MEHRNGLVIGFELTMATGTAERDAAVDLVDEALQRGFHPTTLAGDNFARREQGVQLCLNQAGHLAMTIDVPHSGDSIFRR